MDAEFFGLVCDLRKAQKLWFEKRNHDALRRAKELERAVDRAIEERQHQVEREQGPQAEPSLFDRMR